MLYSLTKDRRFIFIIIFLYVVIELVYGFWNNSTWDDDCPSRYYNTLNAIHDPKQFVSLWNRPLFVLLFFIPVQISKFSIILLMVAISAIASYYLYVGVLKTGTENAWLVLPLFLFQAFYFGVSRNGEVETLAVAIICLGFYCYVSEKYLWFAILGALLPLARLELAPALLIWAIILIQKKKFRYVLIFMSFPILWSVIGGLTEGHFNVLWLFNQVINGEKSENIYGHGTFGHYFQGYPYVLGPIIFFLFIIGFVELIYKRKIDLFVFSQFIIIFFIYVIFSWKLNTGNAAGFLRNLIPLTPFAAILSLKGFNYLMEIESIRIFPAVSKIDSDSKLRKRNPKNKKDTNQYNKVPLIKGIINPSDIKFHRLRYIFYTVLVLILFYFFFSWNLQDRNSFTTTKNYTGFLVLISTLVVYIIIRILYKRDRQKVIAYSAVMTAILCFGFTVLTQSPEKFLNPERRLLNEFSDLYANSYLKDKKTFANHIWFYWCNNLNKDDTLKYGFVTKNNLKNAPFSSLVLWENHYSNRLASDVDFGWLKNNKEFIDLYFKVSSDKKVEIHLFQKVQNNIDSIQKYYDTFIRNVGKMPSTLICRGQLFAERYLNYDRALNDLSDAIVIDSTLAIGNFQRGLIYFNNKLDYSNALLNFNDAYRKDTIHLESLFNAGLCLGNLNKLEEAVSTYSKVLVKDSTFKNAYLKRGAIYFSQSKFSPAIEDYSKILKLEPTNLESLTNRGISYFNLKNYQNAILDFNYAQQLNSINLLVFYFRANCYIALGNYRNALGDYNIVLNVKHDNAQMFYERGLCLLNLSDFRNAFSDLQRAASLGYPVPAYLISKCKAANGIL